MSAPVYYEGRLYEVVKRFYRQSENLIMYDLRDLRTSVVLPAIRQDELRSVGEQRRDELAGN